jgi:L-fucose mutarotase/ribose pyranase (RbsD/FucU family)
LEDHDFKEKTKQASESVPTKEEKQSANWLLKKQILTIRVCQKF